MKRSRKYWLAGLAIVLIALAHRPATQFHRFFLTACAADGPARETELDIDPQPVDMEKFYAELRANAADLAVPHGRGASNPRCRRACAADDRAVLA